MESLLEKSMVTGNVLYNSAPFQFILVNLSMSDATSSIDVLPINRLTNKGTGIPLLP